ncbi:hypothetical protein ABD91_16035 [Lysinibacillus sphaericus]|uniref:HEPN domain-containing protein n=1 Tax=Lysinibacillus sphaericus TaxID=1421 RepID=UPI0018CE069A|nr:HEPN domain-containing protein [Lysinibacillus sphaericus]MBG9692330.1 hypothetical protein [Lysinibacillus sphaericus]
MIKYTFVASAYELKVSHQMNKGTKLFQDIRISNNKEKISELFHPQFFDAIGTMEYNQILSGAYYYAEGEVEDSNIFDDDNAGLEYLDFFMERIQFLNNLLWLLKDNSINTEQGYLQLECSKGTKFHSNGRSGSFYNSKGEREKVEFSIEELKTPEIILGDLFEEVTPNIPTVNVYETNRIERAFYLLQAARAQNYLPERISIFTTLLETLLSTSNSEVTHKLRERISWLLGKDFDEREKLFDDMGVIYSIRSTHVHSSTVPKSAKNEEKLFVYSNKLEGYVRQILIKILTEDKMASYYKKNEKGKYDDSELEKFLKNICLGKPQ